MSLISKVFTIKPNFRTNQEIFNNKDRFPRLNSYNIAIIRIRKIFGYVKTFTCIGILRNTDDSLGSGTKLLLPS